MKSLASFGATFSCLWLILSNYATAADIDVTLFNLPKRGVVSSLTDVPVTVSIREPLLNSAGEVVRNSNDRLTDGALILQTVLPPNGTGRHTISVPALPGKNHRLVNLRFSRSGSADTQVITGIVLTEGRDYRLDLTVPEEIIPENQCIIYTPCCSCCCCQPRTSTRCRIRCR